MHKLLSLLVILLLSVSSGPLFAQKRPFLCNDVKKGSTKSLDVVLSNLQSAQLQKMRAAFPKYEISKNLFLMFEEITTLGYSPKHADEIEQWVRTYTKAIEIEEKKPANKLSTAKLEELKKLIYIGKNISKDYQSDPELVLLFNNFFRYRLTVAYIYGQIGKDACGMTDEEIFSINLYTGMIYKELNNAIRSNSQMDLHAIIETLNRGLLKLKPYTGLVTRGTGPLPAQVDAAHSVGKEVIYQAYTSTSAFDNDRFAYNFKFYIESKNGRYIAPISGNADEEEVLFKNSTHFLVKKRIGHTIYLQEL